MTMMTEESLSRLKQHINLYQELGFCIIPLQHPSNGDGKRPLFPWQSYQKNKSKPIEHATWWVTADSLHNIGVVTGQVSNLIVVDIDNEEAYHKLLSINPAVFGDGLVAKSGRGYHVYLRPEDEALVYKTHTFILDNKVHHIKAEGGYVVAPPSAHSNGKTYQFIHRKQPLTFPMQELGNLILESGAIFQQERGLETKPSSWASDSVFTVADGERNTKAAQLCGLLVNKFPYDLAFIEGMMVAWNKYYVKPPLGEAPGDDPNELIRLVKAEFERYGPKHRT